MTILPDEGLAYTIAGGRRKNPYDSKRRFAEQMLQMGADASPVQHPLQGVARLAQALVGGYMANKADAEEKDAREQLAQKIADAGKIKDPQERIAAYTAIDPQIGMRAGAAFAVEQAKMAQQGQIRGQQADGWAVGHGLPPGGQIQQGPLPPLGQDPAANAIAGIESGGRYDAVGPVATPNGNRAFGKYQVLDTNIGPWTKEVLGREMSPQEFLASPQAQDAVFKAKFGQYRQQYGSDEAAARAWFAGPGGMNNPNARDVNGMTVQGYGQKFQAGMPQQGQPGQAPPAPPVTVQATPPQGNAQQPGAPLTVNMQGPGGVPQGSADAMPPMQGAPPPPQAPGGMPAVTPPAIPDVPRPPPNPQTVARLKQAIARGLPEAQADAILNQEIDRDWSVARERAKMQYDQQSQAYTEGRKPTEAQKAVDTNFGKDYAEWVAGGGFADTQRQVAQLEEVVKALQPKSEENKQGGKNLTGAFIGNTPDFLLNVFNPDAVATRNAVEEVVQRNLRLVLGAQFTEKEGERLIARAYNPSLSEAENAKRVERLLNQIKQAAAAKVSAGQYYEQHGTLRGWSGKLPTIADFDPDARTARGSQNDLRKKYGLE